MIKINREDIVEMVEQAQAEAMNSLAHKILMKYGSATEYKINVLAEDIADSVFGHQAGQTERIFQIIKDSGLPVIHKWLVSL